MIVRYFVKTPSIRNFAETAVEFVSMSLKSDVLNSLNHLIVIENPKDTNALWATIRDACYMTRLDEMECTEIGVEAQLWASRDADKFAFGAYLHRQRIIVWGIRATETPKFVDSYDLFHAIAYHMIFTNNAVEKVAEALGNDTLLFKLLEDIKKVASKPPSEPEIKELMKELDVGREEAIMRFWNEDKQTVISSINRFMPTFVRCALLMAGMTIAVNYFMLLNTQPYIYPNKFSVLPPPLSNATNRCYEAVYDLLSSFTQLKTIGYRLPANLEEYAEVFRSAYIEFMDVPLKTFSQVVHNIFVSSIARTPKEVYLSNPQKYSILFTGLDWDSVRSKNIPALDTTTPSKPIKKPSELREKLEAMLRGLLLGEEAKQQ